MNSLNFGFKATIMGTMFLLVSISSCQLEQENAPPETQLEQEASEVSDIAALQNAPLLNKIKADINQQELADQFKSIDWEASQVATYDNGAELVISPIASEGTQLALLSFLRPDGSFYKVVGELAQLEEDKTKLTFYSLSGKVYYDSERGATEYGRDACTDCWEAYPAYLYYFCGPTCVNCDWLVNPNACWGCIACAAIGVTICSVACTG